MMNQAGKKLWLLVSIALILVVCVAQAIILITTPDSTTSLRPGGLIRGVDGVSVSAPKGALEQEIEIYFERVQDPREELPFPKYLEDVKVIGDFYEITASEEYWSDEKELLFGLSVPEDVFPNKLAMDTLSPPWTVISADEYDNLSLRWNFICGAYDSELNLFGILLPYFGHSPQVFVLVKWEDCSSKENDEDLTIQDYHGEAYEFDLSKYTSRVIHIALDPGEDHYEAVVSVEHRDSDGSWSSPWFTAANYKFYNDVCRDINYCRIEHRENTPHVVRVYDDAESLYLLVSNISSEASFRVTVDTNVIQPPKTLTIESSGLPEAIVTAWVTKEDGSIANFPQPTDYVIHGIRDSTYVPLNAYDYSPSPEFGDPDTGQRIEFSHWSGAVESNNSEIIFSMEGDKTVTADYWLELF